jgi:polyphosphate kinase
VEAASPVQSESPETSEISYDSPALYCNRELSLLAFQERVLEEAADDTNPLLERIKFLAIFGSNLDEFFMVRVAALQQKLAVGTDDISLDGQGAATQLDAIRAEAARLTFLAYDCWEHELLPLLAREDVHIVEYSTLSESERTALNQFFRQAIFPILTPLGYDPGRPFPHISSLSLNLAVVLRDRGGIERFARVKIPDKVDQLIPVSGTPSGVNRFVWLEEIIFANLESLFPGTQIVDAYPFRITRDAEVEIQELESDDLLETIEEAVWQRRFRNVVRLELTRDLPETVLEILTSELEAGPDLVSRVPGPLDLRRLWQLHGLDRPRLKYKPLAVTTPSELRSQTAEELFSLIRREDLLLHHPYDSFQPVVDLLRLAAVDPHVLAIKITLYRVGRDSPIVESLLTAVQEGKQVSVLVELKARFDEESNIEWAKALERNGVHVVYGLVGLKVHCKMALVVRREGNTIRKYVHLGTGNYNPSTARLYTDLSLLTARETIGEDAVTLFNRLTGYSEEPRYAELMVAPIAMRAELASRIEREIAIARRGGNAHLIAKMNALDDPEMMRILYRASQAGVKIDLLVRGICCLRPGLPGVSDNIRVKSIVGRFLEHSRIYYFHNAGEEEILLGSADWMTRNLSKRVEVLFPIRDPRLVRRLKELLDVYWTDTTNAREMHADGTYRRLRARDGADSLESKLLSLRMIADGAA